MLMGSDQVEKILNYGLQAYGDLILPKPPDIFPELGEYLESGQYDDLILLDHEAELVINSHLSVSLDFDEVQVLRSALIQLQDRIRGSPQHEHLIDHAWSWEVIREFLRPPEAQYRGSSPLEDNAVKLEVSDEQRNLLAYLIYQVNAPEHLISAEEAIRQGVAHQIYGNPPDMPDVFDDEDGGVLDWFG
jgi:hypothetical protein